MRYAAIGFATMQPSKSLAAQRNPPLTKKWRGGVVRGATNVAAFSHTWPNFCGVANMLCCNAFRVARMVGMPCVSTVFAHYDRAESSEGGH
jgi:hypothetical protein